MLREVVNVNIYIYAATLACLAGPFSTGRAADPLDRWREVQMTGSIPDRAIRYAQGKWLGLKWDWLAKRSLLVASTNGRQWIVQKRFEPFEEATDLEFEDGLWVLAGSRQSTNALVLTSTNTLDWRSPTLPQGAGAPSRFWRIRRSPTEWILMPDAMDFYFRSTDGQNWTSSPWINPPIATQLSAQIRIADIAYGDGRWVVATTVDEDSIGRGGLAVSTNLTDWRWWQPHAFPGANVYSLKYAHGLWFGVIGSYWVTCSAGTTVITSADGTNWVSRFSGPSTPGPEMGEEIALAGDRLLAIASNPWGCSALPTDAPKFPIFESDPLLSLQQRTPNEFVVTRASGIPVLVEASADLRHWQTITNLPLGEPIQPFNDPDASSSSARFYRARLP